MSTSLSLRPRNQLRGLWYLCRNQLMSNLTYRAHILFQIMASVVTIAVVYFLWQAVFAAAGTPTVRGMDFAATFLYTGLASAIGVLFNTWIDWDMYRQITSGAIIMNFFRPVDFMVQIFTTSLGRFLGNLFSITLPSLLCVFLLFGARLEAHWTMLLFIPSLLLSFGLNFLFDFLVGTICFYTQSIWGISITKQMCILVLSGAIVPLAYFPDFLQPLLNCLPFKSMYHTRLTLLTQPGLGLENHLLALGIQAAWFLGMLLFCRIFFGIALRKLTVAGG